MTVWAPLNLDKNNIFLFPLLEPRMYRKVLRERPEAHVGSHPIYSKTAVLASDTASCVVEKDVRTISWRSVDQRASFFERAYIRLCCQ